LSDFRDEEGQERRSKRFRELWKLACQPGYGIHGASHSEPARKIAPEGLTSEAAENLQAKYRHELLEQFGRRQLGNDEVRINWKEFEKYAEKKETGACPYISILAAL
jgi:hypothetical protein